MKNLSQLKLKDNEKKALLEVKEKLLQKFQGAEFIIYGSKARGDYEEFSDIDLLILLDSKVPQKLKEEIRGIIYDIELEYDVVFGTIVEDRNFWNSPLANVMPFHLNVDREGIRV